MTNPYQSPPPVAEQSSPPIGDLYPQRQRRKFYLWYFAAFVLAAAAWHLSTLVRRFDFLEIPMIACYFPLAGFFDPRDCLLRNRFIHLYAGMFWLVVGPMACKLTPKRFNPLLTAFAFIAVCSLGSILYSFTLAMI